MEEMADELPDHQTGDVYVIISSLPHKHFRREGNDLHTQVELTLFEALYGFTKSLKHLDGHLVELKRTQVTQPEFVAEIAGEGMPIVTESRQPTSGRGRLFIKYTVKLPSTPPLGVFKRELEKASRPVLDHDEL
jgi:DnaJ-class molecular chaperone